MLKIKLARQGRKNLAVYRVVVLEGKSKLTGKTVDTLGHYDPSDKENKLIINKDRYQDWINKGARPTDTVRQLVAKIK